MKAVYATVAAAALVALAGCGSRSLPPMPVADGSLLSPGGGFTLYVSNQSVDIDPVDVRVEIDGELVVSDYFRVGSGHFFEPFTLALANGKHHIRIWSERGKVELSKDFTLSGEDTGVVTFWHNPGSEYNATRRLDFESETGPFATM